MRKLWQRLWKEEDGQGLTEYGLILSLVAIVVIGVLITMGDTLKNIFGNVVTGLNGTNPLATP